MSGGKAELVKNVEAENIQASNVTFLNTTRYTTVDIVIFDGLPQVQRDGVLVILDDRTISTFSGQPENNPWAYYIGGAPAN